MCGLNDVGRCMCSICCLCHVYVLCDAHAQNGSTMSGMNRLAVCYASGFSVGCVGVFLLGIVCTACGVCLHFRDGVFWKCHVPVREVLPMSAVLPVCVCVCVCVLSAVCGDHGLSWSMCECCICVVSVSA